MSRREFHKEDFDDNSIDIEELDDYDDEYDEAEEVAGAEDEYEEDDEYDEAEEVAGAEDEYEEDDEYDEAEEAAGAEDEYEEDEEYDDSEEIEYDDSEELEYYDSEEVEYADPEEDYGEWMDEPSNDRAGVPAKNSDNEASKKPTGDAGYLAEEYEDEECSGAFGKIVGGLGIAIAILLVITAGAFFVLKKNPFKDATSKDVVFNAQLEDVGIELENIETIGGEGLERAYEKKLTEYAVPVEIDEPTEDITEKDKTEEDITVGYEENDYEKDIEVSLEAVSVLKDLKVKFVNAGTGKLIANIPFEIEVKYPDGNKKIWSDSDKDGIIYYSDLAAGSYSVHAIAISDERYSGYKMPGDKTAEVKGEIAYNAVNVADEILDSSQVDEGTEDTARDGADSGGASETITAPVVTDTVTFVESSKTDTYEEVDKSQIVYIASFMELDVKKLATGAETVSPEGTATGAETAGTEGTASETENENPEGSEDSGNLQPEMQPSISIDSSSVSLGLGSVTEVQVTLTGVQFSEVSASSSNSNVATAMIRGDGKMTITGLSAGSATISVAMLDRTDVVASVEVTVTGGDNNENSQDGGSEGEGEGNGSEGNTGDSADELKFNDGTAVYVLDGSSYRKAKKADYETAAKFYRLKTVYTGWQTINGSTYYYTSDGRVVTGTQTIQGKSYTFDNNGVLTSGGSANANTGDGTLGIDVSKWNGKIDWNKVKAAGIGFVIIRVGYRGSSKGSLVDDSMFKTNISGAVAAGLKVGVYFVTQATNEVEAVEEASMVIDRISGYGLSYPVFLDVEASGGRGDKIDKATRTTVCSTFCQTIANAGYSAGIYANKNWLTEKIDASQLGGYRIWVAHYAAECGYTGSYQMWQYTEKGSVDGISGNVDLNRSYF